MTPELLTFGIHSIIRLRQAGVAAREQAARDAMAPFPRVREAGFDPVNHVNSYFKKAANDHLVKGAGAPFAHHWDAANARALEMDEAIEDLLLASIRNEAERGNGAADPRKRADVAAAIVLVEQWDPTAKPVRPWIGVMLTAADIALEYVAQRPELLADGGQGQKIVSAYASGLAELLPDDGNFGPQHGFGQRLGAVFLKAGLATIVGDPDWVSSKDHVQKLLKTSLQPLVDAFPQQTATQQLVWASLGETVMGPVAAIVFETVAEHPSAFLGDDFDADTALGAVTQAAFREIARDGLSDDFTRDGLLDLYRSAVGVIAEKPELFVSGAKPADQLARDMLRSFAGVLKDPNIERGLGRELASTAVVVVGNNAHLFTDPARPWHAVAADLTKLIAASLSSSIANDEALKRVLGKEQRVELGRIVLRAIGESPSLIPGADERWAGVIKAIAEAMAADDRLLLSGQDWLRIASVAAAEAAANPERLFRLDGNKVLAGQLMRVVLEAASQALVEPIRGKRAVLYGATLREALMLTVRALAGNSSAVREHVDEIRNLLSRLNEFVAENHERYGSKEWLCMYRVLLQAVIGGAAVPTLDIDSAENLLRGVAA